MNVIVSILEKNENIENPGIKRHTHAYSQIFYVVNGNGLFCHDNIEYAISSNDCLIVKPNIIHWIKNFQSSNLTLLDIKFEIQEAEIFALLASLPIKSCIGNSILSLIEQIKSEYETKNPYYEQISQNLLVQVLYNVARNSKICKRINKSLEIEAKAEFSPITRDAIKYICNHYSENLSLCELSEKLKYNKIYLCTAFKNDILMTVNDYVFQIRISKACELIKYSDYSLDQICKMTGFKNIQHFTRKFKEQVGVTPGFYKRKGSEMLLCVNDN